MKTDITVDARGLACPLPIVRAKKAMDKLAAGQTMELLTTDLGSQNDFQAWVRSTGHELVEMKQEGGVFTFIVRKK